MVALVQKAAVFSRLRGRGANPIGPAGDRFHAVVDFAKSSRDLLSFTSRRAIEVLEIVSNLVNSALFVVFRRLGADGRVQPIQITGGGADLPPNGPERREPPRAVLYDGLEAGADLLRASSIVNSRPPGPDSAGKSTALDHVPMFGPSVSLSRENINIPDS